MVSERGVSIIIPAYNAEKTIKECLSSFINQSISRNKYEIIVVDDGSKDRTCEIAKKYKVNVISQKNGGPAVARNRGAREAQGDILIFTDADCIADKDFIEKMIKPFSDSEVVGVQGCYKSKQRKIIAKFIQIEIEKRHRLMEKKRFIDFIGTYAAAYKRDIFLKMGGFDTSFPMASGEDIDFSYRLSENHYKMVFEPNAFVYHEHPDTLKSYLKMKFWRAYWRVRCYEKNRVKALKDTYTGQTIKIQMFLVLLMTVLLLLSPLIKGRTLYGLLFVFVVFALTTLPFTVFTFKRNARVALVSPALIFLRALCCLYGMGMGFIKEIVFKNSLSDKQRNG
jgi:glycosyltransferase involved in cell wall biosynthesis